MNARQPRTSSLNKNEKNLLRRISGAVGFLLLGVLTTTANAQEVRYSWLDMSYMAQDVGNIMYQLSVMRLLGEPSF